jgi:hypothetical protein
MPHDVVDQKSPPAHAQTLSYEFGQLMRIQVVRKKVAAHQIKGSIGERQRQCVGNNQTTFCSGISAIAVSRKMRASTVEQCYIQRDAPAGKSALY